jgi:hypothetical protein
VQQRDYPVSGVFTRISFLPLIEVRMYHRNSSSHLAPVFCAARSIHVRFVGCRDILSRFVEVIESASPRSTSERHLLGSVTSSALIASGCEVSLFLQAEGLQGVERVTHPFVRIRVSEQSQLSSVQWQSLNPRWDEALNFR